MYRDGVCRVADRYYTKTIEYEDINYQLAQSEDQAAIFDGWSACLNYFDSSLPFQLSFLNHRSRPGSRYSVNIPMQDDDYNSVRCEYVEMLENQIAKSNNGIVRTKLLTFGVNVDDLSTAKDGLQPVERTVIDRCVRQMYREHLQDPETSKMPTLQTLYDLLCSQPEGEAVRLATALEIYVSGSLNVFNHETKGQLCRYDGPGTEERK